MKIIPSNQLANRLPVVVAYTFRIGNRLTSSDDSGIATYVANSLNQYTAVNRTIDQSVQSNNFTYDADGNLTQDDRFNYAYDDENRLVSVTPINPVYGDCAIENAYDHRNRRVKKIVKRHDGTSWNTAETHVFVWDGWNIVLEQITFSDSTTRTIEYYWGNDLSGTEEGAGGVCGLLATRIDGVFYVPVYGSNGNIMMYVDATGAIAAQFDYDPYGRALVAPNYWENLWNFAFSTKYHDWETDLVAYQLRTYDPIHGRWLNRDPIEERGGENLYAFCGNNSLFGSDLLGLIIVEYFTDKGKIVTKANDVSISQEKMNRPILKSMPSDWGIFQSEVRLVNPRKCTVGVYLQITLYPDLPKENKNNYRYVYGPHRIGGADGKNVGLGVVQKVIQLSDIIPPPYGAVLAHEKGHLLSFWSNVREKYEKKISDYISNNGWAKLDVTKAQNLLDELKKTEETNSFECADRATIDWFWSNGYYVEWLNKRKGVPLYEIYLPSK